MHTARCNRLSPVLVNQLTHIVLKTQLRWPDPETNFARSSMGAMMGRFSLLADDRGELGGGEEGVGAAGGGALGGEDAAGVVAPDINAYAAAADGRGLDGWEDQEEALSDVDPADVDARVSQLLL